MHSAIAAILPFIPFEIQYVYTNSITRIRWLIQACGQSSNVLHAVRYLY